jgi:hypothetical protein
MQSFGTGVTNVQTVHLKTTVASKITRCSVKPEVSNAFCSFKVLLISKELAYFTVQYY